MQILMCLDTPDSKLWYNTHMDLTALTFYHGSAAESVTPTFGLGDDRHDYGKGFYLTDELISGPANKAVRVMSTLVEGNA